MRSIEYPHLRMRMRRYIISSRHFLLIKRSKRPYKQSSGQVTVRSRLRLSTRSASEALARIISRDTVASTWPRRSFTSGFAALPRSAASTIARGIHLKSRICVSGANSEGMGWRAKLDARISPATRRSLAATSIAIGAENAPPESQIGPLGRSR